MFHSVCFRFRNGFLLLRLLGLETITGHSCPQREMLQERQEGGNDLRPSPSYLLHRDSEHLVKPSYSQSELVKVLQATQEAICPSRLSSGVSRGMVLRNRGAGTLAWVLHIRQRAGRPRTERKTGAPGT